MVENGQKNDFLAHFEFFSLHPCTPYEIHPRFWPIKIPYLRYISVVSFIRIAYVVVKLKTFKVFCIDSASIKWNLFGIFWTLSPKYCFILIKPPEVVSNKKSAVFEKSFKILNFDSNGMQLKLTVSVYTGAQFTDGKPKRLVKSKIFVKTASLGIINNVTPRSQKITESLQN